MKRHYASAVVACLIGALAFGGSAFAAKGGIPGPPPGKGETAETGANNLSFPVVLSENVTPAAFPVDAIWKFATINGEDECIDEDGVEDGTSVPPEYLCYYGRKVMVESETGEISFEGEPKVWWLQKRTENFWKTLSVGHDINTPLVVSAVDIGDLLESSPAIQARQIRVEFNLLQNATTDSELSPYVADFSGDLSECYESWPSSLSCFAALAMSGAVPGTEQSGNEMQGTDFGPGPTVGLLTGTQNLIDPTTVRSAVSFDDGEPIDVHALVYSRCARLLIQKIPENGTVTWDPVSGQWTGAGVGAPEVNVATDSGWSTEITSSGAIVYGYNWNAKTAATGIYRLTLVLDGNDPDAQQQCSSDLATKFEMPTTTSAGTKLVNVGENNQSATIIYAGDSQLGDEGGLVYIDVPLTAGGGGGGGGGGGNPNR